MHSRLGELLLIVLIVFILFGPGKLPQVISELNKGLRSLQQGLKNQHHVKTKTRNKNISRNISNVLK